MTSPVNTVTPIVKDEPFIDSGDPIVDILAKYFAVMADRFGRALDPITVNGYVWALKRARLTEHEVEIACRYQFISAKFWPSPAELIQEAVAYRQRELERAPKQLADPGGRLVGVIPALDPTTEREKECKCGAKFRQSKFDRESWDSLDAEYRRILKRSFPDGYCPDACRACIKREAENV